MTPDRFNDLLNGPLHHPMPMFAIARLAMALKQVVDETGEAGAHALEVFCGHSQATDKMLAVASNLDSDCLHCFLVPLVVCWSQYHPDKAGTEVVAELSEAVGDFASMLEIRDKAEVARIADAVGAMVREKMELLLFKVKEKSFVQ